MNTIRGEMLIQVVHGRIVGGVVMASTAMADRHDVTEMWSRRTSCDRQAQLQQPLGEPRRQRFRCRSIRSTPIDEMTFSEASAATAPR